MHFNLLLLLLLCCFCCFFELDFKIWAMRRISKFESFKILFFKSEINAGFFIAERLNVATSFWLASLGFQLLFLFWWINHSIFAIIRFLYQAIVVEILHGADLLFHPFHFRFAFFQCLFKLIPSLELLSNLLLFQLGIQLLFFDLDFCSSANSSRLHQMAAGTILNRDMLRLLKCAINLWVHLDRHIVIWHELLIPLLDFFVDPNLKRFANNGVYQIADTKINIRGRIDKLLTMLLAGDLFLFALMVEL